MQCSHNKTKKNNHATAVATNSESCNGAVGQMFQVQKFFLLHHNSLLLEANKCVHNVSEDGLQERNASKHSRQIFRKKGFCYKPRKKILCTNPSES